jgi:hypothetical protein
VLKNVVKQNKSVRRNVTNVMKKKKEVWEVWKNPKLKTLDV